MPPETLRVYSCAFSPDGKYFAIGYSVFLLDFEKIKAKIEAVALSEPLLPLQATIIYPNPTHDVIQVKFYLDKPELTTITIVDLAGKIVKTIESRLLVKFGIFLLIFVRGIQ
jgi:WD40 repeat protein